MQEHRDSWFIGMETSREEHLGSWIYESDWRVWQAKEPNYCLATLFDLPCSYFH
jgi:hypothetical protein